MKLYYIAKKVGDVASDIVEFVVQKKPGVKLTTVGDLLVAAGPRLGANVARVIGDLLIAAGPKGAVAVNENVSGAANADQVPAISANNLSAGSNAPPTQADGSKVTQVTYDLVRDQAATSSSATDWQAPTNAHGSTADGNVATLEGGTLRKADELLLGYADPSGKDEFTIDKVEFVAYYRTSGTLVTNTSFELRYYVGGSFEVVRSWAGNQSWMTTPLTVDITSHRAWTWADLANVQAEAYGSIDSGGNGVLFEVDVIYFRITASKTDIL